MLEQATTFNNDRSTMARVHFFFKFYTRLQLANYNYNKVRDTIYKVITLWFGCVLLVLTVKEPNLLVDKG